MPSRALRECWAIVAPGTEALTSSELRGLGLRPGVAAEGGVPFAATDAGLFAANLWLRTASRVVVRVAEFRATAFHELERFSRGVEWERFIARGGTVRLRVTCRKSRLYHSDGVAQRAIVNSLFIASTGATATILLCAFIAFLSTRTRLPGRKLLDTLTMIPMGFPGIVLAVGLLHAWIAPPLVLYGTIWILYVAYMTRYLPVGVRTVSATLMQIHPELEESSLSCGANWFQTFWRVTLPLLRPGIFAGWALLFLAFTRELSASILLYSPRLEVLSVVIFDMYGEGSFRLLSALTMLQVMIALVVLVIAKTATRLDQSTESQSLR